MTKFDNADYGEALRRIYNRVDMEAIREFINQVPYISDLQKRFYTRYIEARLDAILRSSFEIVISD